MVFDLLTGFHSLSKKAKSKGQSKIENSHKEKKAGERDTQQSGGEQRETGREEGVAHLAGTGNEVGDLKKREHISKSK